MSLSKSNKMSLCSADASRRTADFATETGVAILSITHFRKGAGEKAIHRVTDSSAFGAASRASYGVFPVRDMDGGIDPDKRAFSCMKTNMGKKPPSVEYEIEEVKGGGELVDSRGRPAHTSRVKWGRALTKDADTLMSEARHKPKAPKRKDCVEFFNEVLPAGEMKPVNEIKVAAEEAGIAPQTLKETKQFLRIRAVKIGNEPTDWAWERPVSLSADYGGAFLPKAAVEDDTHTDFEATDA